MRNNNSITLRGPFLVLLSRNCGRCWRGEFSEVYFLARRSDEMHLSST